jgi:hypothetical protein
MTNAKFGSAAGNAERRLSRGGETGGGRIYVRAL